MTDITHRRVLNAARTASTVVVSRGMGPLSWLGILFVVLKLFEVTAVATWSWWLVLLPFYLPFAIVLGMWGFLFAVLLACVVAFGIFAGGMYCWEAWKYRKRRAAVKSYGIKRR